MELRKFADYLEIKYAQVGKPNLDRIKESMNNMSYKQLQNLSELINEEILAKTNAQNQAQQGSKPFTADDL